MRPLVALALAAVTTTALAACTDDAGSAGGESSASASASASSPESSAGAEADPVPVLQDAVDATLALTSFTLDGDLGAQAATTDVDLTVQGAVDYDTSVADLEVTGTAAGITSTASLLSDGTTLWVGLEGDQVPTLPGGARYLEGSADQLVDSPTFSATGLLAPVLVLRGVKSEDQVEALGPDDVDGTAVERYRATLTYDEAVAATSEEERGLLEDTFALGGDPSGLDLTVDVAVGEDSVVRELDVQVLDDAGTPQGSYAMTLSDIGADVAAPTPPDPSEVASGALVERLLDRLDRLVAP